MWIYFAFPMWKAFFVLQQKRNDKVHKVWECFSDFFCHFHVVTTVESWVEHFVVIG